MYNMHILTRTFCLSSAPPWPRSVVDIGMDLTGMMEKKGNVYPFVKSAGMGYAYGHEKEDGFNGVCQQVTFLVFFNLYYYFF